MKKKKKQKHLHWANEDDVCLSCDRKCFHVVACFLKGSLRKEPQHDFMKRKNRIRKSVDKSN